MAPNFSSILDKPASEVERPKPIPQGTYFTVVQGQPRFDKSSKKQTEFSEYQLKITGVGEDVDEAELEAWSTKGDGSKRLITDQTIKATFYHTEDALWRLKEFLEHCGIELEGKSLREAIEETPGSSVGAFVKHEPSQDGQSIFARFSNSVALEG